MSGPSLAAALIVRDEARYLPGCLQAAAALVDEIVVYDTGSRDDSVAVARAHGARVALGYWDGDFARARNEAMALTRAGWVLSVDADELVVADPAALRGLLSAQAQVEAFGVRIDNLGPHGQVVDGHVALRLLRRDAVSWANRVHERPVRRRGRGRGRNPGRASRGGGQLRPPGPGVALPVDRQAPAQVLRLDHLGYAGAAELARKTARNAEIAQQEVDALAADPGAEPGLFAYALLSLGRSCAGLGDAQRATEALSRLRADFPDSPEATIGTDVLADLLLAAGAAEQVPGLVADLRAAGVDPRYCAWLQARALIALDRPLEALRALDLRGAPGAGLRDAAGRERSGVELLEVRLRALVRSGQRDDAVACLVELALRHGRYLGRAGILLRLWGARPIGGLVELLRATGGEHLPGLLAELRACPDPGPDVAAAAGPGGGPGFSPGPQLPTTAACQP